MTVSARPGVTAQHGDPVRSSFNVRVSLAQGTLGARRLDAAIAAWIFAPDNLPGGSPASIWYLAIPGAAYRRGLAYFDRQVPGYAAEEFSIARFLARNGIGLVVIDTLGTGESEVNVDGGLITRFVTAEANAQVLEQMQERLLAGMLAVGLDAVPEETLFLGGFGFDLGAFQLIQLAVLLEGRATPLDAAIFAGWSNGPADYARLCLDETAIFTQMVTTNGYYAVPRAVIGPLFYGHDPTVPPTLIEADEQDTVVFPKGLLDEGLIPGIVVREAGALSCPVLYVVAAHDFSTDAQGEGAVFGATRLFTAYTQPQAAHYNFESSRTEYWQVIVGWSRMVALPGHPFYLRPSGI